MTSALPEFIRHLLAPQAYDHEIDDRGVRLAQTHISYVLLAGDFVYKFKKPVNFGFLDFTSLAQRHYFCEQELLLNRRLCPSLYLGLVTINRDQGRLSLNGPGEVLEYGVKMARMDEEKMMGNIIKSGGLNEAMLERIIDTLTPFYQQAEGNEEIRGFGTAASVGVNVLENFSQTEQFVGSPALSPEQFETIQRYARTFLENSALFQQRIEAGKIRDCHGDLYSANICLDDTVYIFDCIEFNQRFRYIDVASDVAFMAMDLDFYGLNRLSAFFIKRFCETSGDETLLQVLNFYKCYRAYVRGKIGLFTAHAPEVDAATRENSMIQARKYFELAQGYAGA